jgi:hypothetical protein
MQNLRFDHEKCLTTITIGLILISVFSSTLVITPVFGAPVITLKWSKSTGTSSTTVGPLAADVNNDGSMEVIKTGSSGIAVLNGSTGAIIWSASYGSDHSPAEIIDLNNDGIPEILLSLNGVVALHGNNGSVYWHNTAAAGGGHYIAAGDIDADGYPEIYAADHGLITALTHDGHIFASTYTYYPCWSGMTIGDTDFDCVFEVYLNERSNWYPDANSPGKGIRAFWAENLTERWNHPDVLCSSHCPTLADVDGDGDLEIISLNQRGGIAVINTDGSVNTYGGKYRKNLSLGLTCHSQPTTFDVDDDGNLELITNGNAAHDLFPPKIWDLVEWKLDATLLFPSDEPPGVADVDGDGKVEIINCNPSNVTVFKYNATIENYDIIATIPLGGAQAYSVAQDIDGDGLLELIFNKGATVYVYDLTTPAPTPRARTGFHFYSQYRTRSPYYTPPPGPQMPFIDSEQPPHNSTDQPLNPQLSARVRDWRQDKMNITFRTNATTGIWHDIATYTNVSNGILSQIGTGMDNSNTTYFWSVSAVDSTGLTSEKEYCFTTYAMATPAPWWNNSWLYRKLIRIDPTKVAANLTDFPVLVEVIDSDFAEHARTDAWDLLFTDYSSGTQLDHEIESYESITGHLVAWVNVPFVSSTEPTLLYLYYGNPAVAISQENVAGTWGSNYMMVQHLSEGFGTHYDSTANGNDASPYGDLSQNATGKIDGADDFDGTDDYLQIPHADSVTGFEEAFTASAWVKIGQSGNSTYHPTIFNKYNTVGNQRAWAIDNYLGSTLQLKVTANGLTPHTWWQVAWTPVVDAWYYVTVVWEANENATFYINGEQLAISAWSGTTVPSIFNNTLEPLYIGKAYTTGRNWNGAIDEARISNIARSAEWISTSYNNQLEPSSFYIVGSEEGVRRVTIQISPSATDILLNDDCTIFVEVTNATDLFAWEFQLDYDPAVLDLTSASIVPGGLNEPTQAFYSLTDETAGHLWWAVSSVYPTTTGITYDKHAIFALEFHTIGVGTSDLGLYGTLISDSAISPILHSVANGSVTVTGAVDLTVTNVVILTYDCSIYANDTYVNGSDYYYPVEVTVRNAGSFAAGPFHVQLEVSWGPLLEVSAEISVSGLEAGESTTINFTELFHPTHTGFYHLVATVDSKNNITESDETNNMATQGDVKVTVVGDINGDDTVNILDAVSIALAWGAEPSDPDWNVKADINHDSLVSMLDGTRIGLHWGETP